MSSIHGDPMSVDPMSVGKPDHTSADVDPKSQIYSADPFADGPPPPPAMTGRLGTTASAHESAETAAAPSGRSNRAPEARKPSTATPATPALTLPASSGFKACRYGCHGGCTEPDGVCVKMKQSWIRGEKSARRGDTPDNGKDRATWAKSSS
jgi:hypothetical protein